MENDILEKLPEGSVFSIKTIIVSSFFGGILASSYMLYQNFKTLGEDKKARMTILISTVAFLFMISISYIPFFDKAPNILYSIFFTVSTSYFANKYQRSLVINHQQGGGKIYESGRSVLICIISLAIIASMVLIPFYLQDTVL